MRLLEEYERKIKTYEFCLQNLGQNALKGILPSTDYIKYMDDLLDSINIAYSNYVRESNNETRT